MDAVLLTWRWQNLFAVGVMMLFWFLLFTTVAQISMRRDTDVQQ